MPHYKIFKDSAAETLRQKMLKHRERLRFMQCFHCHKVMFRLPLPAPRNTQVQHKCVGDKVVTRKFGKKVEACKKQHTKDKQNPNGACLITISKGKYLSQPNDKRYALMISTPKSKDKKVSRKRASKRRAVKARYTAKRKRTSRVKKIFRVKKKASTKRKKVTSARRTKKRKRKSKKRETSKGAGSSTKSRRVSDADGDWAPQSASSSRENRRMLSALQSSYSTWRDQVAASIASRQNLNSKTNAEGTQASVYTGSSLNPITVDSDEEKSQNKAKVPVDDIRIGEYGCARTRFDYPSVECSEDVVTLYVWDKKRNDEDEKEGKETFEVDIPYPTITYATFSKSNKLCYIVFETSKDPLERRSVNSHSRTGCLEGKFIHNSQNTRKRSIVIASAREDRILLIRKQFHKFFPEGKGLKATRPNIKSKKYLKFHGLKVHKVKRRGSLCEAPQIDGEEEILVYPGQETSRGAVTLTMNDVRRLQPGVYLNDNLLDFYLQYLYREKWDKSLQQRVHLFNTFFFKKWSECTQQSGEGDLEYDFSRYSMVRKWTKNVDIFKKDFLVIPVNHKFHWSLAIVCFPGAILDHFQEANRECCILGFDSLKLFRSSHFDQIKRYMNMAWKNRSVRSERHLPFAVRRCIPLKTPSQNNGADCGVFVLHNCEKFFDQGGFSNYKSPSPGANWYPKSDIARKRRLMLELINIMSKRDLSAESSKMLSARGKGRKKFSE